jgi:hypothetical protein
VPWANDEKGALSNLFAPQKIKKSLGPTKALIRP